MKQKIVVLSIILVVCISVLDSCINTQKKIVSDNNMEKTDSCSLFPSVIYEIFIPKIDTKCTDRPLLIVIDPHGNGKLAINKFRQAAEDFNCILVASNTIKNGSQDYVSTINLLIDDAREKYVSGKVLLLAGFSGGARMVLNYAQYFPVSGVISCGALASPDQFKEINIPVMCIIGMTDFNFVEAAQYIFNPEKAPKSLSIQFTEDTHAWPGTTILRNALGLLLLNLKNCPECASLNLQMKEFVKTQKNRYDSLVNLEKYIEAALLARNFVKMGDKSFEERLDKLEYNPEFNNALDQLRESIRFELTVRNAYYSALQEENAVWWEQEIKSLSRNIANENDPYRRYALKRIKGFLGIMCYSLSNNSLRNNDLDTAKRILAIYRIVEPENPDMFYFSALFEYKNHHPDQTGKFLHKALDAGFSDIVMMKKDFPPEIVSPILKTHSV